MDKPTDIPDPPFLSGKRKRGGHPRKRKPNEGSGPEAGVNDQDQRGASQTGGGYEAAPDHPDDAPGEGSDEAREPVPREAVGLLQEIGEGFAAMREGGRAPAWTDLQLRLSRNMHVLVPEVVGMKEFVNMLLDIESFIKSDKGSTGDPRDMVAAFLRGETDITFKKVP